MSDMNEYYEQVQKLKAVLIEPKDPRAVQRGDADTDEQMAVCAKNAQVYARLEVKAGARLACLERDYATAYLAAMVSFDDAKLEAMSAVRSHKEKLVKASLAQEQYLIDETHAARKYFARMGEVMIEWLNIYKKFRKVE